MKVEIKKDFSDETKEYDRHNELIAQKEKFHKEKLQQKETFQRENLEEQRKSNKENSEAMKVIEHKRYSQYEKWQKWSIIIAILLLVANLFLVFANVMVWNDNHQLIKKQLESLTPFRPELQIILDDNLENLIIHRGRLADMRKTANNETWISKERLHFRFQNIGRMDTGHITGRIKNDWIWSGTLNIPTIEGESNIKEFVEFWYDGCYVGSDQCKVSDVPLGIQPLEINFKCDYCENKTITKIINICIWENSTKECDNFKSEYG